MSALLLERPPALDDGLERDARRGLDGAIFMETTNAHGRLTLDDLITGAWEGLAVRGTATCPVCAGPMGSRSSGAGGDAPTSTCLSCGSRLS
jgi:hypothetical protein